jgi:hypothetical protein
MQCGKGVTPSALRGVGRLLEHLVFMTLHSGSEVGSMMMTGGVCIISDRRQRVEIMQLCLVSTLRNCASRNCVYAPVPRFDSKVGGSPNTRLPACLPAESH